MDSSSSSSRMEELVTTEGSVSSRGSGRERVSVSHVVMLRGCVYLASLRNSCVSIRCIRLDAGIVDGGERKSVNPSRST